MDLDRRTERENWLGNHANGYIGVKMRHTIRDVATAAGVSTATVSRVLAPDSPGKVTETTRRRVLSAAEKLGYRINHAARSLKTRSTRTVAVVAPELANDFFMELAGGIERVLGERGYTLLLASSANSVVEEKKRLSLFQERMVDGVVVIPAGSQGEHLQALADRQIPVVMVDRLVEGADLDAVVSDNEGGTFELTRALLADGFRRIGFAGGDITLSSARERLAGFGRALAEAGLNPEPDWICLGGMGIEDGYKRMETFLSRPEVPDALVAVNLLVHLGMERRLLAYRGDNKPVIAGFDASLYTPFFPCCRYTAVQDAAGIGTRAGQRILELITARKGGKLYEGGTGGKIIRLPVSIVNC